VIGTTGMFCGFAALSHLPLPDATAIGYAAPLVTVVLAALILKETVRAYRWTAVVVGFVGVLVMLSPHLGARLGGAGPPSGPAMGALFGLAGACCAAGATIQIRRLTATERTGAIVLYFSLLTTLLGLSTVVLGWRMPDAPDFALLALIGVLGGIGQILMTQSYRYADTSIIAPFDYTTMIFAVLIGWFAFGDLPSLAVTLGAVVVISAGIFVVWRERHLGLVRRDREAASSQRVVGG
jgi:drug/metabolite transporter (DMT)-like permease